MQAGQPRRPGALGQIVRDPPQVAHALRDRRLAHHHELFKLLPKRRKRQLVRRTGRDPFGERAHRRVGARHAVVPRIMLRRRTLTLHGIHLEMGLEHIAHHRRTDRLRATAEGNDDRVERWRLLEKLRRHRGRAGDHVAVIRRVYQRLPLTLGQLATRRHRLVVPIAHFD